MSAEISTRAAGLPQVTLLAGWGHWDVTHFPCGGCFRRFAADTAAEIIVRDVMPGHHKCLLPDGRTVVIKTQAVREGGAT